MVAVVERGEAFWLLKFFFFIKTKAEFLPGFITVWFFYSNMEMAFCPSVFKLSL